ncbi:MAG: threonine/serine dehydratase [Bacteroidota bacterium]
MVTFDEIQQASRTLDGVAHRTPLLHSSTFNRLTGSEVWFKAENFQRIGAFKFRGAYNKISSLNAAEKRRGVIAHSSGNHAQGVALASKLLGVRAVVVMPEDSVLSKVEATRTYGAEVVFCGKEFDDRARLTAELQARYGYVLVHPYDDPKVIAGQGTVGLEILQELPNLEYLLVPVGGGGLIAGSSIAAKRLKPTVKVIGVETEHANDAYQSFRAGKIIRIDRADTIADGIRPLSLGSLNFEIIRQFVDDIITVSDDDVIAMMQFFLERTKTLVEPTGAVAAAALSKNKLSISGKTMCAVISGGNVDMRGLKALL